MMERHLVALVCKLAPGMFSSERVFSVELANGEVYRGITPRHFCWNLDGKLVTENETVQEADGLIAARRVDAEELAGDQIAVEVPDGEVIAVKSATVRRRPTPILPPKAPCLGEPKSNVPV